MGIGDWIIERVSRRAPDLQIGGADDPYLNRWYVIPRNPVFNIYLHQFMRSDDDRALHDHPWISLSWCLRGEMIEISAAEDSPQMIEDGNWVVRTPTFAHRLIIMPAMRGRVWTLFITGPRLREWGFWCPQGWVHWKDFTSGANGEIVGRGCGEP